ncbi:plasmid stabilization system protein ParE [Rhizobium skierniewicense]|uniref:Plasmid stabilization system protein ParE n=1 Tax=Rhizobium skierniewicense TaxID=984260 RepID=A0A7W6G3J5_9HYPH|nr:type II toxin-antitoxin system RelE/ParE family toxin [Rhizobium skierniewicense]MBB3947599.1 plasmid stabilization system protein ParE [Rhizobium skierniewicense]
MRVIISRSAAAYLRNEVQYLKSRNPIAATRFIQAIAEARRNIEIFPDIGQENNNLPVAGCKTWVFGDYLMDYMRKVDVIEIVAVRHGRMRPLVPGLDPDDDSE